MSTHFTMSDKPRNRQPARGGKRVDVDVELAKLPSGFAYASAGPDTREQVQRVAAALLAEEIVCGLATKRSEFIGLTKSHAIRADETTQRQTIEAALAGDKFLGDRADEIESLPATMTAAERELAAAERKLAEAEAARDAAKASLAKIKGFALQLAEARKAVAPTCPVTIYALEHARALRGD